MHFPHLKINYFLKSEINELYINNAIRSFAVSTIAIFIPIFLLTKGYSMYGVLLYLLVNILVGITLCYFAFRYVARKGAKHSMIISTPFLILFFFGLYNMDFLLTNFNNTLLLILLSVIASFSGAFYFMGFHVDFAKSLEKNKSAKQVSIIQSLGIIFSIIGPLFGAIIITNFSFQTLFLIIIIILCFSIIPLLFSKEIHEPFDVKIKHLFSKEERKRGVVYFAEGIHDYALRIFWPLLLYFLVFNLNELGGLFSLSNMVLAIFTIYIGRKIHTHNKKNFLKFGTITHTLTVLIRTVLKTLSVIAVVQSFGALTFSMLNIPFQSMFYNNSRKKGITHLIFIREFYLHLGRFLMIVVAAILLLFLEIKTALILIIILGGLFTLLMMYIKEE